MPVYFSDAYAAAADTFDTLRKAREIADSLVASPIPGVRLVEPRPLKAGDLCAVHAPGYVLAVHTGKPRHLAATNGLRWDRGLWAAVCASNGGAVAAARYALENRRNAGSLSSGLHHARRDHGAGFCTFNGLALAARAALDDGAARVLIVDLDAHCGGGTDSLVRGWAGVVQLDIALSQMDGYQPDESSRSSLDIVTRADDYLPTLRARLASLDDLPFDLVLYNAGMDVHQDSAIGGVAGMTTDVIASREQTVFEWARARGAGVAFVLAGGYTGGRLDPEGLVRLHRLTIAAAAVQAPEATTGFQVLIDDNFHYMDADERVTGPQFETYAQARDWVREFMDCQLEELYEPGMDPSSLITRYKMFGEDPWISPTPDGVDRWSAWDYAAQRAEAVCRAGGRLPRDTTGPAQ